MNERYSLVMFSKSILVLCLCLAASNVAYADGSPIVGTWLVESHYDITGDTKFLQSINKEKTMIGTTSRGQTAYGIWRKVGNHDYQTKSTIIVGPDDPYGFPAGAVATFVSTGTYDKKSDTFTTSGTATWTFGENNDVLYQDNYQSVFHRYTFDD